MKEMCSENHLHFDYVRLAWDSGFCFDDSKVKSAFDISTLGLVDIEKVTRDRDVATVEKHIPTILQYHLDEELTRILEPTFVKVVKLCQLSIQYLRFCKKYLDNTVAILKKDLNEANEELTGLRKCVETLKTENNNLSRQYVDLKETVQTVKTVSYKCSECPKVFFSEDYLQAHVLRRHDTQALQLQSESERLQLEIKELKERLNSTEKFIHSEKEPDNDAVFDKEKLVQEKFEQLKEHIEKELSSLRDESFYRKIYEKWFGEVLEKMQAEKATGKVFVEQGSGDCVELRESSTQTNLDECQVVVPSPAPRKLVPKELDKSDKENKQENKQEEARILDARLKKEAEAQREMFENILEQKLAGSIGKLETHMTTFWKKMDDLETKRKKSPPPEPAEQPSEETKKPKAPVHIPAQLNTRYITKSPEEPKSESSEDSLPAPKIYKVVQPVAAHKKPIAVVSGDVAARKIVRVASFTKAKSESSDSDGDNLIMKSPKRATPVKLSFTKISDVKKRANVVKAQQEARVKKVKEPSSEEATSESSGDFLERDVRAKPSNSTLGTRSFTSLKRAALDDELRDGLKTELETLVNIRLKEMGVAPQWRGIPDKTYQHASSIVAHQAEITKKQSLPNFNKIREDLLKVVDKKSKQMINRSETIPNTKHKMSESTPKVKCPSTIYETRQDDAVNTFRSSSSSEHKEAKSVESARTKKKHVNFDLESDESLQVIKPTKEIGGSTSSLPSSILDGTKLEVKEKEIKEEGSDWDVSDIA